jgi:hypothetical protein
VRTVLLLLCAVIAEFSAGDLWFCEAGYQKSMCHTEFAAAPDSRPA